MPSYPPRLSPPVSTFPSPPNWVQRLVGNIDRQLFVLLCAFRQARMAGTNTDVRFMTNLVNAAAKQRRWVMASQLVQLMRSYGVPPNEVTYTCILSQMSKAKQVSS